MSKRSCFITKFAGLFLVALALLASTTVSQSGSRDHSKSAKSSRDPKSASESEFKSRANAQIESKQNLDRKMRAACLNNIKLTPARTKGFFTLTMGISNQGYMNGNEVKAFFDVVAGMSPPCDLTEIVVHDTHYWVRQPVQEVAQRLAEALGQETLQGFVILRHGAFGHEGYFCAKEMMAVYTAAAGINVKEAPTEVTEHADRYWVQNSVAEVLHLLAQANGTMELEGWVVLHMADGREGHFNAENVMVFSLIPDGLSVKEAQTQITVHDYPYWIRETPDQVDQAMAEVLNKEDEAKPQEPSREDRGQGGADGSVKSIEAISLLFGIFFALFLFGGVGFGRGVLYFLCAAVSHLVGTVRAASHN